MHKLHVTIGLGQREVSYCLLVEPDVPADLDPFLRLRLFETLVVIRLKLHEGPEDVLVLVAVFVSGSFKGNVN